ncbi:MAG: DUF4350 domain-containing protein [Flavobacteriales bacterium]|nr:DUF4350 domain-containing protein [Flavobacteriales bacterium]
MKNNLLVWLAFIIVIAVVANYVYTIKSVENKSWEPHFNHASKSPYGTSLLYNLLEKPAGKKGLITINSHLSKNTEFSQYNDSQSLYFFCGPYFFPDQQTISLLINFIKKGNDVLIASESFSSYFLDSLLGENDMYQWHELIDELPGKQVIRYNIRLKDEGSSNSTEMYFRKRNKLINHRVHYFPKIFTPVNMDENSLLSIESCGLIRFEENSEEDNYLRINTGKGSLYLYSTPIVFTNYHLKRKDVFMYTSQLFEDLNKEKIWWQVHERLYDVLPENETGQMDQVPGNPFSEILAVRGFRYAWYTLLAGIILFCLVSLQRRQRVIGMRELKENTSLQFAETISKLYLGENNHKNMALLKYRYFYSFIRQKYHINLYLQDREGLMRLSKLLKTEPVNLEWILQNYKKIQALPYITYEELSETNAAINHLYFLSGVKNRALTQ